MLIEKGKWIAVLGGGQLGKMLCESAKKQGYKTMVLEPSKAACAALEADLHLAKPYDDKESLLYIAKNSSVVTYEFENVPSEAIDILEENGGYIPQGRRPLYISQHRFREKSSINKLGIKTAEFRAVTDRESFEKAVEEIGYPSILKTSMGGYDGKGQWVLRTREDFEKAASELEEREYILEKMVDFKCELSCIAVKSTDGSVGVFPVVENIHKNGILHITIAPARIGKDVQERVKEITKKVIEGLDFVGPLAIEYFYGKDGEIYVNEMAPRPHNSAHYTMDGCDKSQFDLQIEGICGKHLEDPKLVKKSVMLNILGQDVERIESAELKENEKIYMYGKGEAKVDRKMGHLNLTGEDLEALIKRAEELAE